jgi:16S rRNA (cytidine1402-2'-O)-methyltransferase
MGEVLGTERRVFVGRELTKMYQQFWRGNLGAGAEFWANQGVRGEIVVVIEGAPEHRAPATDADISEALVGELRAGMSRRDAVAAVVELTGEPKRRVYDLALQLPSESG